MMNDECGMANIVRDKSFEFAVQIVSCYRVLSSERKEFVLSKQLLRAGTSVGANVREGINAQSTPDFIHKLSIAQKECDESIYWLELLRETGYITDIEFKNLNQQAIEILKILKSIILTSKSKSSPNS